jgi:hypothetical protein
MFPFMPTASERVSQWLTKTDDGCVATFTGIGMADQSVILLPGRQAQVVWHLFMFHSLTSLIILLVNECVIWRDLLEFQSKAH